MVQYLNARQAWELSVRNAIDQDRELPMPENDRANLSRDEISFWAQYTKQTIHYKPILTPEEWKQTRPRVY